MPTYSYLCEDCQTRFDAFASISKKENGWKPSCPRCGSSKVRQTFDSVGLIHVAPQGSSNVGGCCSPRRG